MLTMKEIIRARRRLFEMTLPRCRRLFQQNVVPSYGRFDIVLSHGAGAYLYDITGKRYLDLGGGIAVSSLGHAHPAITEALVEQSKGSFIPRISTTTNRRGGWPRRW